MGASGSSEAPLLEESRSFSLRLEAGSGIAGGGIASWSLPMILSPASEPSTTPLLTLLNVLPFTLALPFAAFSFGGAFSFPFSFAEVFLSFLALVFGLDDAPYSSSSSSTTRDRFLLLLFSAWASNSSSRPASHSSASSAALFRFFCTAGMSFAGGSAICVSGTMPGDDEGSGGSDPLLLLFLGIFVISTTGTIPPGPGPGKMLSSTTPMYESSSSSKLGMRDGGGGGRLRLRGMGGGGEDNGESSRNRSASTFRCIS